MYKMNAFVYILKEDIFLDVGCSNSNGISIVYFFKQPIGIFIISSLH